MSLVLLLIGIQFGFISWLFFVNEVYFSLVEIERLWDMGNCWALKGRFYLFRNIS